MPVDRSDEEEVPRIGRGRRRGRLPMRELMTVMMLLVCLVAVLGLRQGCADGVANLFRALEPPPDGAPGTRVVPVVAPEPPPGPREPPEPILPDGL